MLNRKLERLIDKIELQNSGNASHQSAESIESKIRELDREYVVLTGKTLLRGALSPEAEEVYARLCATAKAMLESKK